ncbi:ABC transporter permease [Oceanirhabdus seepicola]|uniref:ABC transporter permease n=1 Tax=Oceanirhabdus seepicola TaxID=2828781 RepID=A0A9J6PAB3_9CLOT|nr:ABC transporter permease [Oceanirhabdus seepicola]MCM1992176.1 ABC transporter permease [Oceanirhabdus seepicola]
MGTIVLCELKKIKIKWWHLLSVGFLLFQASGMLLNSSTMKSADDTFTWIQMGLFSYAYLAVTNVVAIEVILREFINKTASTTFSYEQERWKIYIGKLIAIFIISLMMYAITFCFILVFSIIKTRSTLTSSVIVKHLILTIKAYGYQMLMVTVTASIALACKNYIVPLLYIGIQLVLSFLFLCNPGFRSFIPFPLPVINNLILIKDNYNILDGLSVLPSQVAIAVILFIGGIVFGCVYINRMEVEK